MGTRTVFMAVCLTLLSAGAALDRASAAEQARPKVEVVFCLDTTGSMGGLIEGAKIKIWSIANGIAAGKPTPEVSIGLVAYRDVGDLFVTKVFPLDGDLDSVFERLQSLSADGGGDTPEHVNRALSDAVRKTGWSADPKTLKLIFLVGDCPPHMDYADGYDYRKACAEAVKKDIIINTIQCGGHEETTAYWKDIAKRAEGEYAAVAQDGGMQVVQTPFDAELAELGRRLEGTVVAYGAAGSRETARLKKEKLGAMAPAAAAERAFYKSADSSTGGSGLSAYDLVDAVGNGTVKLDALEDRELPEEMRGMSPNEGAAYLKKVEAARARIVEEIETLSSRRSAYIGEMLKKAPARDSFDSVVRRFLEAQAAAKGIRY